MDRISTIVDELYQKDDGSIDWGKCYEKDTLTNLVSANLAKDTFSVQSQLSYKVELGLKKLFLQGTLKRKITSWDV